MEPFSNDILQDPLVTLFATLFPKLFVIYSQVVQDTS